MYSGNTTYQEYMRSVLGYTPNGMQDTYQEDYYVMPTCPTCQPRMTQGLAGGSYYGCNSSQIEGLYPPIYRAIYPLVCRECSQNTMPITEEVLERMVDNVYRSIELDLKIETNVKVETRSEEGKSVENRGENERETRQSSNFTRDLIKILILQRLFGDGFFRPIPHPPRPPFPGGPRPPFPGGPNPKPPMPGPRPPMPRS